MTFYKYEIWKSYNFVFSNKITNILHSTFFSVNEKFNYVSDLMIYFLWSLLYD